MSSQSYNFGPAFALLYIYTEEIQMKTLSLFTILLTVNFLISSVGWGVDTEADCKSKCAAKARTECAGSSNDKCKSESINACVIEDKCEKNAGSECSSLARDYRAAQKKAVEQCARMGANTASDTAACLNNATECQNDLSTDPEDNSQLLNSVFGVYASIKGLPNGSQQFSQPVSIAPNCVLSDDDKEETSKERIQDKMQKLNEEIADLKKEQMEADKDLNEKKEKVNEDIQKLQEEVDKNKNERQTEDQKKAADIAKQTLAAEKTQAKALLDIEAKNRDINQVKLSVQSKVLQYSDTNLMIACKNQIETKKKELIAANKGKGSKGTGTIKNELQAFADTCIQSAKASRKQELQGFQDKIAQLNSDIAEKYKDIQQSKKTIQQEQSNLDALKKISDEAEQKELQMQQSKTNRLNQSVIDMQTYIDGKKKSMDEKITSKMKAIQDLIAAQNKKKPKYSAVIAEAKDAEEIRQQYKSIGCCESGKTPSLCSDTPGEKRANSRAKTGGKKQ